MTWPPVRTAMSWSIALRRSPKPGALTATALNVPRILLTTSVASASPSTSSAMMTSGLPVFITASSAGSSDCTVEIFAWWSRMYGVLEHRLLALRVGHEVRRQVALVELHALGELELGAERVRLLDGHHAVLADLVDRLGDDLADRRGRRPRSWPTLAMSVLSSTSLACDLIDSTAAATAFSMPA